MARNDQPTVMYNYNTDQFVDPVTGLTVHDDGLATYTQPQTGRVYAKARTFNGLSTSGYISYQISLVGHLITEDAAQYLITEDATQYLIIE